MGLKQVSLAVVVAAAAFTAPAFGQPPPRGAIVYAERCKECHESGDERAPTREQLAARTPAEIVAALTTGPMAAAAEGLSPEDKQAIADWLTTAK
jgi:mono/diheme cytochrome c family protein